MSGAPGAAAVESASPWRQPILWLVLAMPAAMVVAGVFLVRSAIGLGSLDASTDRVDRTAQVQTTDLTADLAARAAGLAAVLHHENGMLRVTALSGDFPRGQPLSLLLQHPIDTHADRVLVLQPDAQGWSAPWTVESGHDWILELTPANRNWRLQGRWLRAEAGARLQPSLRTTAEVGWNPRRDTLGLAPKWSNAVSTVHHATAETTLGGDPRDYAFRGVGSALRSESTSGDGHASR